MYRVSISANEKSPRFLAQQKTFWPTEPSLFQTLLPTIKLGLAKILYKRRKAAVCFYLLGPHFLSLILCFEREGGSEHEITGEKIPEEKSLLAVRFKN